MKSLRSKLQPALLLDLMGGPSHSHQFSIANQLRGILGEIGRQLERKPLDRNHRETQPTTIQQQHGKSRSPRFGPLELGEAGARPTFLGFRQFGELKVAFPAKPFPAKTFPSAPITGAPIARAPFPLARFSGSRFSGAIGCAGHQSSCVCL
jgi:hypothetical protein